MKNKKKRNRWKTAFLILAVLIVIFFVWVFLDDDDYGYYDDWDDDYGYYDDYDDGDSWFGSGHGSSGYGQNSFGSGSGSSSAGTVSTVDNTSSHASFTADDTIRDSLVTLKGHGEDTVTILVYMNGSDLETEDGQATADLSEMVAAGSSDKVNVLVETLGTKSWNSRYGISSRTAQRYRVTGSGLRLVQDSLGNVNCGDAAPLTDFIRWGVKNYPADRYILMFWDHGGGAVYGFGYDDRTGSEDSLTVAEMQKALRDAGAVFDFIGMDCCIMSSLEVCCALYDYCDYTILSEDFESGEGWYYTGWLKALYANSSISTPELGKIIVDGMVSANSRAGEDAILAVIDESCMKLLYTSWLDFAYANEKTLLGANYSRAKTRQAGYRVSPLLEMNGFFHPAERGFSDFLFGGYDDVDMSEYYVTDIMAVAENILSDESDALAASLNRSIVYMSACGGSSTLTGIAVTLPYGDTEFYDELSEVLLNCGFDSSYVDWLSAFASSKQSSSFFDYDDWDDDWGGWDSYYDDYDWEDWGSDWTWFDEYDDSDDWGRWDSYYDDWGRDDRDSDWGWFGGYDDYDDEPDYWDWGWSHNGW